ncbi:MAG: hypothetical protein QXI59_00275 [Candidatus Bathyarchaeia archaeon]
MSTRREIYLILGLFLMGFTGSIFQILIVRELIVTFYGNELSLSLIFLNWMVMVAFGSIISTRMVKGESRNHFAIAQILISILIPIQILFARGLRSLLGVEEGIVLGIIPTFYSSLLTIAPISILVGSQFILGCKLYAGDGGVSIGKVYLYEASGAAAGGFTFAYILVHYTNPLEAASYLAILNLLSALLIQGPARKSILGILTVILLTINVYALSSGYSSRLHEISTGWRWMGYNIIDSQDSIYGNIAVTEIEGQYNFFNNGLLMFTSPDPDIVSVEEAIHFPMLIHPTPRRVLIIGGGVGGLINEALKHPVEEIHYVEPDPLIIQIAERYESSKAHRDPKVKVEHVDARLFVKESEGGFDIIVMRLPPPSTLQLNRFYTEEFFKEVHRLMRRSGVFSLTLPSSEAYMSREMKRHNDCIHKTVGRVFASSIAIHGDQTVYLASPVNISYDTHILTDRFRMRALDTRLLNENYIKYKQNLVTSIIDLNEDLKVNNDMKPIACYYNIVLWNVMYYPELGSLFEAISERTLWLAVIGLSTLLVFISTGRRGRFTETAVSAAVLTTGFAGMTLNITLIYAFQSLYGYIYHAIAILTTSFNLGLVLGASTMNRLLKRLKKPIHTLAKLESMICIYSIIILFTLIVLFQTSHRYAVIVFPILNVMTGLIVGVEFPLASAVSLDLRGSRLERVAGRLYASDLLGACLGTVLAGVFLIPVLGIQQTCIGIFVLNLTSLALILSVKN